MDDELPTEGGVTKRMLDGRFSGERQVFRFRIHGNLHYCSKRGSKIC